MIRKKKERQNPHKLARNTPWQRGTVIRSENKNHRLVCKELKTGATSASASAAVKSRKWRVVQDGSGGRRPNTKICWGRRSVGGDTDSWFLLVVCLRNEHVGGRPLVGQIETDQAVDHLVGQSPVKWAKLHVLYVNFPPTKQT